MYGTILIGQQVKSLPVSLLIMLARTRTAAKLYQTCRQYSHFQPRFARMYATYPPHTVVRMPALSPTMTQGNLGEWAKKLGDPIAPGDVLVAIETDKAQMDYECQDDGFLAKILMPANTADVLVNTVNCLI